MQLNKLNQLEDIRDTHVKLAALRLLFRAPLYRSNVFLLSDWLEAIGMPCSSAELFQRIHELEQLGLISTTPTEGYLVAEFTAKGTEVAEGKLSVDSVLQPPPDCTY